MNAKKIISLRPDIAVSMVLGKSLMQYFIEILLFENNIDALIIYRQWYFSITNSD
jgi:hypothetical protein